MTAVYVIKSLCNLTDDRPNQLLGAVLLEYVVFLGNITKVAAGQVALYYRYQLSLLIAKNSVYADNIGVVESGSFYRCLYEAVDGVVAQSRIGDLLGNKGATI
eukprot:XP_001708518.1 Hypothetical protein GL50803_12899 [Giardia lamblia ATCC 50803]